MKAKIGNIIVQVWQINFSESENDYEPWLKEAIKKKLVGWGHNNNEGNISGILYDKWMSKVEFPKSKVITQPPKLFKVTSYGPFPNIGQEDDYLIYSEQLVEKYRIISKNLFEKEYKII